MRRFWLGCALACLLAACASAPQLREGRLQPPSGFAYVVVSVTLDALYPRNADAALCIRGSQREFCLAAQSDLDFIRAPGKERDGNGRLHVVALPPGHYRITEFLGGMSEDGHGPWGGFYHKAYFDLDDRFALAAGEVIYLGNYHLLLNYMPSFRRGDAQRRDFNDLRERWGVTSTSNITPRLAFTK